MLDPQKNDQTRTFYYNKKIRAQIQHKRERVQHRDMGPMLKVKYQHKNVLKMPLNSKNQRFLTNRTKDSRVQHIQNEKIFFVSLFYAGFSYKILFMSYNKISVHTVRAQRMAAILCTCMIFLLLSFLFLVVFFCVDFFFLIFF